MNDNQRHVIYPTLTEKSMIANVPQIYLFLDLVFSLFIWLLFESILFGAFIGLIIYVVGVVYTRVDPDFAEIILIKRAKLNCETKSKNELGNRYIS